jgi:hypothetical protein
LAGELVAALAGLLELELRFPRLVKQLALLVGQLPAGSSHLHDFLSTAVDGRLLHHA